MGSGSQDARQGRHRLSALREQRAARHSPDGRAARSAGRVAHRAQRRPPRGDRGRFPQAALVALSRGPQPPMAGAGSPSRAPRLRLPLLRAQARNRDDVPSGGGTGVGGPVAPVAQRKPLTDRHPAALQPQGLVALPARARMGRASGQPNSRQRLSPLRRMSGICGSGVRDGQRRVRAAPAVSGTRPGARPSLGRASRRQERPKVGAGRGRQQDVGLPGRGSAPPCELCRSSLLLRSLRQISDIAGRHFSYAKCAKIYG